MGRLYQGVHQQGPLRGGALGLESTTPDPDQFDIWHSSKAKPGQLNFTYYKNPEVDRILTEQRRTFDREKRRALIFKLPGNFGRGPALHLPLRG